MSRKTNLMLGLITVSMVVRAISSILASKKVAQTQGVGNFYALTLDTKTDGKGMFRVEHGLNSECKPNGLGTGVTIYGMIAAVQADNDFWYTLSIDKDIVDRKPEPEETEFGWDDTYVGGGWKNNPGMLNRPVRVIVFWRARPST